MNFKRLRQRLRRRKRRRDHQRIKGHRRAVAREKRAIRFLRRLVKRALRSPTVMYDSVIVENIPHDAKAVAGYVDANYVTFPQILRDFPNAHKVSISILSNPALCLDMEPGAAGVQDYPAWFHEQKARGVKRPIAYIAASRAQYFVEVMAHHGIHRGQYRLWTAHWDGEHICGPKTCGYLTITEADGTQWTSHGETVDESKLHPDFF